MARVYYKVIYDKSSDGFVQTIGYALSSLWGAQPNTLSEGFIRSPLNSHITIAKPSQNT